MVVRFLASVSLMSALVAASLFSRPAPGGEPSGPGILVAAPRCEPEPPEPVEPAGGIESAICGDDPRESLAAAFVLIHRGLADEIVLLAPDFPRRILRALAQRRLEDVQSLALGVLLALGDVSRRAALEAAPAPAAGGPDIVAWVRTALTAAKPVSRMEW